MSRKLWLVILLAICLFTAGCRQHWTHNKPDPTKGVVTGIVLCGDTGKPARFASVILTSAPKKDDKPGEADVLPAADETVTDLDGRFRLEGVEPGQYYAYATQDGYLDPKLGIDLKVTMDKPDLKSKALEAIRQWRDHLVEVTVGVHKISDLSLTMERGAEIRGTVTFDDGSPAIGMGFHLSRKKGKGEWAEVDSPDQSPWSADAFSNGHGHYDLSDLPAGEYIVCAMLPTEEQNSAPRVCLGDTFRRRNAKTVKVAAGEVAEGADIEIPLAGLHKIEGRVTVLADGHVPSVATVHLMYADDREEVRKEKIDTDGNFSFEYVPEDKFLLRITDAKDSPGTPGGTEHPYADKEIPLTVKDDVDDIHIELVNPPPPVPPQTP